MTAPALDDDAATQAIRAGCNAADLHLHCSFPTCGCRNTPTIALAAARAYLAAPVEERTLSPLEARIAAALHHLQADGAIDRGSIASVLRDCAAQPDRLASPVCGTCSGTGEVYDCYVDGVAMSMADCPDCKGSVAQPDRLAALEAVAVEADIAMKLDQHNLHIHLGLRRTLAALARLGAATCEHDYNPLTGLCLKCGEFKP